MAEISLEGHVHIVSNAQAGPTEDEETEDEETEDEETEEG